MCEYINHKGNGSMKGMDVKKLRLCQKKSFDTALIVCEYIECCLLKIYIIH